MNFLLCVEFDFKNKSLVKKIQAFERFLTLTIIVDNVLGNEKINKNEEQKIKKLIKYNSFGLCKNDYKFLFKTIKTFYNIKM